MLQIGFFDPVEFITAVTDMSTWSFPYDALTAGISGTVDWLKEEEHLFLSPVPTVPRSQLTELPKDGSVTEFFPGAVLPFDSPESFESYGQAGEIYLEKAPSDYSPQGYEEKENVYQYQANQWVLPAPHFSAAPRQLQFAYSVPVTPPVSQTPPNTPFDDFSPPRKPLGSINNKSRVEEKKECANCKTTTPSMWRWNYRGERECNACCLFETHNGMKRPPSRWSNNPMKRRKRRIAKADLKEEDESTRPFKPSPMLPSCPLRPSGPTLVFHCLPSVPVPPFCLPVLYDFVKKFLPSPIQKFVVCAIDQGDKKTLEKYSREITNGEVMYMPLHGWEKNAAEYLLWLINMSALAGTVVLVTKNSCYAQNLHRIQQLGWQIVLVHPPGADMDLIRTATQVHLSTFVLPVQLEPSRVLRHMPTIAYQNLSKKVVEMSPLDLEGTRRFIEQFKKTTCGDTWSFFDMTERDCPLDSVDYLTPILEQYPTLDVATAVEMRTDSSSSGTEATSAHHRNADKTVEELFQRLQIAPIGNERKKRSMKHGHLETTAAEQLIARAKDILAHQRRTRRRSVSVANRLHQSISAGWTLRLSRIHKSRKEELKLLPYELDEIPSTEKWPPPEKTFD